MINPIITRFSAFAGVVLMSLGGAAANARTSDVGNALDRAETRTELVTGQQAVNGPVTREPQSWWQAPTSGSFLTLTENIRLQ